MMIKLTNPTITLPNFSLEEFDCKCGCGLNNMKLPFLWKLQQIRTEAGFSFVVRSGSRCPVHNENEGGAQDSDHLTGEGVDIGTRTSWHRWRIIEAALSCGIKRIGIGRTFTHLGDNPSNPQLVMWVY